MNYIKKLSWLFLGKDRYDIGIFSFPKCGRTWLDVQLGRALTQHYGFQVEDLRKVGNMYKYNSEIPRFRLSHEGLPQRKKPAELETSKHKFKDKKIIFLVRDPRDVFVSFYFHRTKRRQEDEGDKCFHGTISDFLKEETGGFETILRYFNIWYQNREVPKNFLLIRYEDMKKDPAAILKQVAEFSGLSFTDAEIADAIEFASFENMQKIESGKKAAPVNLVAPDAKDKDSYRVRKGKVGGYVDYFTPEEVALLNRKMSEILLPVFGYEPNIESPAK